MDMAARGVAQLRSAGMDLHPDESYFLCKKACST